MIKLKTSHALLIAAGIILSVYLLSKPSEKPVAPGHLSAPQVDLLIGTYCKGWSDGAFRAVSVINTDSIWNRERAEIELGKDSADFARVVTASNNREDEKQ